MDTKGCLFIYLLCAGVGVGFCANNVHGSICSPNERFLFCGGCQKTCQNPAPVCESVCRTGCFCNEDEVRNDTGHCVKLADCPPIELAALHSSEPRHSDLECPQDEEYASCQPCNRTCENPNPICPAQCGRGCYCKNDLVRDRDGRCVKLENCSTLKKIEKKSSQPVKPAYELQCGPHQVYSSCQTCERVCSSPTPECHIPCSAGCFCEEGYLKAPNGKCVKLEECPKAEVTMGGAQDPSIEDCSTDEIYLSCGWCEPSCWEPKPECPRGVCTRGCLCRPPLLRHHSGYCVAQQECTPQKCPDPNEEFVCRYGCEARCIAKKCIYRPRHCVLGCHCKFGLLRDYDGRCVTQENCQSYEPDASNNTTTKHNSSNMTYLNNSSEGTNCSEPYEAFPPISKNAPKSVFDVDHSNVRTKNGHGPYKDALTKAVKIYKEFIHSPRYKSNNNEPLRRLTMKGLGNVRFYKDENIVV